MTATTTKKKICWQCEGRVDAQVEHCPFCGVYIGGTFHVQSHFDDEEDSPAQAKDLQPLYTPENIKQDEHVAQKEQTALTLSGTKTDVLPLLFVLAGSLLFIFSLVLLLFSDDGLLKLVWNANYWFLYFLISLPLLFLGWRFLGQLQDKP